MDIPGQYPHRVPGAALAGAIGPPDGRERSPRGGFRAWAATGRRGRGRAAPAGRLSATPGLYAGDQVSMLGPADSGTRCAGGSGSTTADSTVRSGRTWTSSPEASMRQPRSPSSSSEATTTEGSSCSAGACTDDVALRTCKPAPPAAAPPAAAPPAAAPPATAPPAAAPTAAAPAAVPPVA